MIHDLAVAATTFAAIIVCALILGRLLNALTEWLWLLLIALSIFMSGGKGPPAAAA